MKYFSIAELARSSVAEKKHINNRPPNKDIAERLQYLIEQTLDPIREVYGKPITVNSGYRCELLNKEVGGAIGSQHTKGEAADITTGSTEGNIALIDMIKKAQIPYDQLINEYEGKWVHVSCKRDGNRKQVLSVG